MGRVRQSGDGRPVDRAGHERRPLVPAERGSELALEELVLAAGASAELSDDVHDTIVYVCSGGGSFRERGLGGRSALLLPAGERARLTAGRGGIHCLSATLGAATDLHAPMGDAEPVVALTHVEPGQATGARSFQILYGPHNGSTRGTLFVGYIPPGKAPWHYHLYDEIVWVLEGEGRLHLGDEVEPLERGCAFRLRPRELHIVENAAAASELVVLGLFTPAGSPSAAYLEPEVAATYAVGR